MLLKVHRLSRRLNKLFNRVYSTNLKGIKYVNTENIPRYKIIKNKGLVTGTIVQTKHIGHDLLSDIKSIFGGELSSYTTLLSDARDTSIERMCEKAKECGANAIINVRMETNAIASGSAELLAYGTAIVIEKEKDEIKDKFPKYNP